MQGADFLYFLRYNNDYYYVDPYGNVLTTTVPTPLTFTPDGWQEISILTERNKRYFGMDRTFTIPLNFVEDGARIIKHIYYNQGIEGKLNLLILEQQLFISPTEFGFYYTYLHEGEVDFSTFVHESVKVTCNIMEGGTSKLVKANESTSVEIDIDSNNPTLVRMDGLLLKSNATFYLNEESHVMSAQGYFPIVYVNQEGYLQGIQFNTEFIEWTTTAPMVPTTGGSTLWDGKIDGVTVGGPKWFVRARATTPVRIVGNFKVRTRTTGTFKIDLVKHTAQPNSVTNITALNLTYSGDTEITELNFDKALTLNTGDYLQIIYRNTGNLNINQTIEFISGEMQLISEAIFETTEIKALRPLTLLNAILQKIGITTPAVSDLLTLNNSIVCTSGDALRGFEGAKIKTSLAQFFNSFNAILNIGMGVVNGVLRVEEKAFWFQGGVIDLGEISNLKVSAAPDWIFPTIKAGYNNQEYDNVNGRDEFNTTVTWSTPVTRKAGELNLVSDYRADMYGIELTRINLIGKKTTDSSSDNDTFVIKIQPDAIEGVYKLDRSLNPTATGITDPATAFNLPLSPGRMIRNHGWYIRSFLAGMEAYWLKFQVSDKNNKLSAGGITENADIAISDLDDPKFKPSIFEFETIVPDDYQALLDANPVRVYTFTNEGILYKGLALKSGIEPSTNKAQVFQLLAAAQDLTPLIDFDNE